MKKTQIVNRHTDDLCIFVLRKIGRRVSVLTSCVLAFGDQLFAARSATRSHTVCVPSDVHSSSTGVVHSVVQRDAFRRAPFRRPHKEGSAARQGEHVCCSTLEEASYILLKQKQPHVCIFFHICCILVDNSDTSPVSMLGEFAKICLRSKGNVGYINEKVLGIHSAETHVCMCQKPGGLHK